VLVPLQQALLIINGFLDVVVHPQGSPATHQPSVISHQPSLIDYFEPTAILLLAQSVNCDTTSHPAAAAAAAAAGGVMISTPTTT
jgi:hypothetical protein